MLVSHRAVRLELRYAFHQHLLQQFLGRLMGMPPEFVDPKLPSRGDGREVTRVESTGHVIVKVNIIIITLNSFSDFGDDNAPPAREKGICQGGKKRFSE